MLFYSWLTAFFRRLTTRTVQPRLRGRRTRYTATPAMIEQLEPRLLLTINVSGNITSNTVWSDTTQPYLLVGDLTVSGGVTLTIQSGVEVRTDYSLNEITINGVLDATGVSFVGNETDIYVKNGGRLNLQGGTTVAGDQIKYESGSLGTIANSEFSTAKLRLESSTVTVSNNEFNRADPVYTTPSLVPQLYNNTFVNNSTVYVYGTATSNATWRTHPNLTKYLVDGDITVNSGVTLTIQSGVEVRTDYSLNEITINGVLDATGVSFVGNQTDIYVKNGGRLNLQSGSSVAGDKVTYESGSLGDISYTDFYSDLVINSVGTHQIIYNSFLAKIVRARGNTADTIDLRNNYWGTTDLAQIEQRIEHDVDNAALPLILFDPFLPSAPPAELSVAATSATNTEGNVGTTPFTFTVTRSGDTGDATNVNYAVTGSGATQANAADFLGGSLPSGTINFLATETSKVITINVIGDTLVESNDGFTVTLSNATNGATITTSTATGTIQDDDAVNDAPVLANGSNITYTENGAATAINTLVTVNDLDHTRLATGTVTMTNFVAGQDVLGFVPVAATMGNIALTSNVNGVMSLASADATATLAQWQTALRAVTYTNTSDAPTATARTVTFVTSDGDATSNTLTNTINITAVNDAPAITGFDTLVTYVENGAAQLLDSDGTPITVTDPDSPNFDTGTMTVSLSPLSAPDVLSIRNEGTGTGQINVSSTIVKFGSTVIGTFTGGTNTVSLVITLNTNATPAAVQALARNLTFRSTSENPSTAQRTAKIVLTDGDGGTRTVTKKINVTAVNDAPVLASTTTTIGYVENGIAKAINSLITVIDPDHAKLPSATVRITNFVAGQDVIGFVPVVATMGNIVATSNVGGLLTLTSAGATATTLQWQAALRAVTYLNTSDNPTTTTRNVQFATTDGTIASNTLASTITVTAVADAPTILNFTPNITFTEGGVALLIDTDVTVSDPDTPDTGGGVLKVYTNVVDAADRLAIRNEGTGAGLIGVSGANVTFGGVVIGTFSGGVSTTPLTITLNASARYASIQALLRNVTFRNTSTTPVTTARTLRVSYHNGLERIVSKTLNVVATIPQPVLTTRSTTASPSEPTVVSPPFANAVNTSDSKRRRTSHSPDSTNAAALDTASAAQRRANRRRGL